LGRFGSDHKDGEEHEGGAAHAAQTGVVPGDGRYRHDKGAGQQARENTTSVRRKIKGVLKELEGSRNHPSRLIHHSHLKVIVEQMREMGGDHHEARCSEINAARQQTNYPIFDWQILPQISEVY
jgi:hypothetical protein